MTAINFDTWPMREPWREQMMTRYRAAMGSIPVPRKLAPAMRLAIYDAFAERRPFCFMRDCGNLERVALARGYEAYRKACASVES